MTEQVNYAIVLEKTIQKIAQNSGIAILKLNGKEEQLKILIILLSTMVFFQK